MDSQEVGQSDASASHAGGAALYEYPIEQYLRSIEEALSKHAPQAGVAATNNQAASELAAGVEVTGDSGDSELRTNELQAAIAQNKGALYELVSLQDEVIAATAAMGVDRTEALTKVYELCGKLLAGRASAIEELDKVREQACKQDASQLSPAEVAFREVLRTIKRNRCATFGFVDIPPPDVLQYETTPET